MAKRKKRKKLPSFRLLERKADKAMSRYIRTISIKLYDKCPLCGINDIKCCFHFVSRRRKVIRWKEMNTVGACNTCNYIENYWADLSRAWFIKTRGVKAYLDLVEESKQSKNFSREELAEIAKEYQSKLAALEGNDVQAEEDPPDSHKSCTDSGTDTVTPGGAINP